VLVLHRVGLRQSHIQFVKSSEPVALATGHTKHDGGSLSSDRAEASTADPCTLIAAHPAAVLLVWMRMLPVFVEDLDLFIKLSCARRTANLAFDLR